MNATAIKLRTMRTAYLDCVGGISGDMLLGALLDAGADADALISGLKSLGLPDWELEIGRTTKSGIAATKVEVVVRGTAAGSAPLVRLPPSDSPSAASGAEKSGRGVRIKVQPRAHAHGHTYAE